MRDRTSDQVTAALQDAKPLPRRIHRRSAFLTSSEEIDATTDALVPLHHFSPCGFGPPFGGRRIVGGNCWTRSISRTRAAPCRGVEGRYCCSPAIQAFSTAWVSVWEPNLLSCATKASARAPRRSYSRSGRATPRRNRGRHGPSTLWSTDCKAAVWCPPPMNWSVLAILAAIMLKVVLTVARIRKTAR